MGSATTTYPVAQCSWHRLRCVSPAAFPAAHATAASRRHRPRSAAPMRDDNLKYNFPLIFFLFVRTPPSILVNSALSCMSVAITLILLPALIVMNSGRCSLDSLQNMHVLLSNGSHCRCRFLSAARVSEGTALFCAVSSLFKLNMMRQDLCHYARCLTKWSRLMSSSKLSGIGSLFSLMKAFTFSGNDLSGSHRSSVRAFKAHQSASVVCWWHTIHVVPSIMRAGLLSKAAAAETRGKYLIEKTNDLILKQIVT